jgi:hypothetical protein
MKLRAADVPEDVVVDHRARARQQAYGRLHALAAEHLGPDRVAGFGVRHGDAASLILAEEGRIGPTSWSSGRTVTRRSRASCSAAWRSACCAARAATRWSCRAPRHRAVERGVGNARWPGRSWPIGGARHLEALREEAGEEQAPR